MRLSYIVTQEIFVILKLWFVYIKLNSDIKPKFILKILYNQFEFNLKIFFCRYSTFLKNIFGLTFNHPYSYIIELLHYLFTYQINCNMILFDSLWFCMNCFFLLMYDTWCRIQYNIKFVCCGIKVRIPSSTSILFYKIFLYYMFLMKIERYHNTPQYFFSSILPPIKTVFHSEKKIDWNFA